MAKRTPMPLVAKVGFGIATAAFVGMLGLGFTIRTVESGGETVGCGSVFSPRDEPACESVHPTASTYAVGLAGVVIGLGVVVVGTQGQRGA